MSCTWRPAKAQTNQAELKRAAAHLDELLCKANPMCVGFRENGLLGGPRLAVVEPGTFSRLSDLIAGYDLPPSRSQLKVPRRVDHPHHLGLLSNAVIQASPLTAARISTRPSVWPTAVSTQIIREQHGQIDRRGATTTPSVPRGTRSARREMAATPPDGRFTGTRCRPRSWRRGPPGRWWSTGTTPWIVPGCGSTGPLRR